MANQIIIDIGAVANDGTGDPLRTAFNYVNNNFSNIWTTGVANSNIQFDGNRILTTNTNGNLVLAPNGIGKVQANVDIVPNANNTLSLGSLTRQWNTVYAQNLTVAGDTTFNNLTVSGNLTVDGDIIQIGNLVTDAKTIQLANTAGTDAAANGSGITVGANDDVATLLYNSSNNVWTTNIGISSVGNITAPYFFGNGSQLTGLPVQYGNSNVTTLLSNLGSNIISGTGNITTTGNISGGYILGDGSQLTGLPERYGNANVAAYLPTYTGNIQAGNINITGQVSSNLVPVGNNTQSLGTATNRWSNLYLSGNTLYLGNATISATDAGVVEIPGVNITFEQPGSVNILNVPINRDGTFSDTPVIIDQATLILSNPAYAYKRPGFVPATYTATMSSGNIAAITIVTRGVYNDADPWATINADNMYAFPEGTALDYDSIQAAYLNTVVPYGPIDANITSQTTVVSDTPVLYLDGIPLTIGDGNVLNVNGQSLSTGDLDITGTEILTPINNDLYIIVQDEDNDGWGLYNRVNDSDGSTLAQTRLLRDEFRVTTDFNNNGYEWTFDDLGRLNLPGNIQGVFGGNTSVYAYDDGANGSVELKTISYIGDTLGSNIRVTQSNATISTNNAGYTWQFANDGNLTLPRGSIVYETNIPGSTITGNTIALKPSSGIDADQQLLIYPTAAPTTDANHLHLTTGNLYNTELYLGNDDLYVKLANTGNIIINSNDGVGNAGQWTFGTNESLTLPGGSRLRPLGANLDIFAGTGSYVNLITADESSSMGVDGGGGYVVTAGGTWNFGTTGNLTAPGNISATGNVSGAYVKGNGSELTNLPAPTVAQDITSNGAMSIMTYDSNLKYVSYATVEPSSGNIAGGNISATSNIAGNNLIATGNIVLTGSLIGSGASPAPSLSGFSSLSAITLSASGNVTGSNLISNNTIYGNVDVVLGNIANASATRTRIVSDTTFSYIQTGNGTVGSTGNIVFSPYSSTTQRVVINTASGNLTASGNVTAQNFVGNGAALSNVTVSVAGNIIGTQPNVTLVAGSYSTVFDNTGVATFPGNVSTADTFVGSGAGLTGVALKTLGSWTVATGTNTYSITVPANGAYQMWVRGNIPDGIITYQATINVTNTNVPVLGSQRAYNYTGGGSPILLVTMPTQIVGAEGTISTAVVSGETNNVFDFVISNTSGSPQTIFWGYVTLS